MKKIIGIIHPFDMYQTFHVYQDGNKIETIQIRMNEIPDTIFDLSNVYNINQIDLSGSKHFIEGIAKQIQEQEKNKYNKNKLVINCI